MEFFICRGAGGGSDGISFHMFVGCDVMKIILRCCWKLKYYHLSRDYQSVMQAFAIFIHDRNYIASTKNVTAVCSRAMLIGGKMKKVFTRIAREKRRQTSGGDCEDVFETVGGCEDIPDPSQTWRMSPAEDRSPHG